MYVIILRTHWCILMELFFSCTDHGLARLVQAYRVHGHKAAKINPLHPEKPVADSVPEITTLSSIIKGQLNTAGKLQPWT